MMTIYKSHQILMTPFAHFGINKSFLKKDQKWPTILTRNSIKLSLGSTKLVIIHPHSLTYQRVETSFAKQSNTLLDF
jgi:hypothetical protein